MPAPDRSAKWQEYQNLPPDARQQLAARAAASAAPAKADPCPGPKAGAGPRDGSQAKANVVPNPALAQRPKPVAPTVVQAAPGATTRFITRPATPPEHQQSGMPKITATPEFVNRSTLLPQARAAGRRRGAGAAGPAPAPPGRPGRQAGRPSRSRLDDAGQRRRRAAGRPPGRPRRCCGEWPASSTRRRCCSASPWCRRCWAPCSSPRPGRAIRCRARAWCAPSRSWSTASTSSAAGRCAARRWRCRPGASGSSPPTARGSARRGRWPATSPAASPGSAPATLVAAVLQLRPWPTLGAVALGIVVYACSPWPRPGGSSGTTSSAARGWSTRAASRRRSGR